LIKENKEEGKTTGVLAEEARASAEFAANVEPVRRRFWLCLVELLNLAALVGALTELCLERRVGRPAPRLIAEW
jgi:hypothetical protein